MFVIISIIGVIFLVLAALAILYPHLIIKLVNRLDMKWSVDKELFLNYKIVRIAIGAIFILAAVILFYASYSMTK